MTRGGRAPYLRAGILYFDDRSVAERSRVLGPSGSISKVGLGIGVGGALNRTESSKSSGTCRVAERDMVDCFDMGSERLEYCF